MVYAGTAYGAGSGVLTPIRRMVINVNWFRVNNETQSPTSAANTPGSFSNNDSDRIYAQLQYNVRKLILPGNLLAGKPVNQLFRCLASQIVNTYSFSISRWFNFF